MITASDIRTKIDNLLSAMDSQGIIYLRSAVVMRGVAARRTRVTWASPFVRPSIGFAAGAVDEYLAQRDAGAHSAIFDDGSLLQMEYDVAFGEVCWHRLAFYPCPFALEPDLLAEFGLNEAVEASRRIELVRLRSPVRFDFNAGEEAVGHAKSHMHFNHSHCRVPVCSPVAPERFLRFIVKSFYPESWTIAERGLRPAGPSWDRTISEAESRDWHVRICR